MSARSKEIFAPLLRKAVTGLMTPEGRERWAPRAVRRRSKTLKNELWLRDHLRSDIPSGKYALYFMQHQPEASVATQAPHMVDQAQLIEQLAVNAPAGWRIVVKEHPRTYPTRGRDFYRPLVDLPNVHLCQPSVASRQLLEGASVVVALTGSVGMEALFAGKKVAVVGRPYYSFFPGVIRLDRPGELFDLLDTVEPAAIDDPPLQQFAAAYYASVFDLGTLSEDGMWPKPAEGGASLAAAVRRHLALIERGVLGATTYPIRQR